MGGTQDVANFTGSLVDWVRDILPEVSVEAGSGRDSAPGDPKPATDQAVVRLASVEGLNGPRSSAAVARRLKLNYRFDLSLADPAAEHQALADLAFALLERDDLAEGHELIRGERASIEASFALDRRRDLAPAKPVREAVIELHPNSRISGSVRSDKDVPIPRARVQIAGSDRLLITDRNGAFAFAAPDETAVRATVTAKGRTAEVELRPGSPNVITFAMEP